MNEIGQNIRRERNRRSWTQKYVAQAIGTTEQNVSRWERGQTVPDTYYRQKLSEFFGLSAEEFGFFYDEKKNTPESGIPKDEKPEMDASQDREKGRTLPPPQASPQSSWLRQPGCLLIVLIVFLILSVSLIATNVFLIANNAQSSRAPATSTTEQEHNSSDDQVDGWYAKGNVLTMKTSTDVVKEGSHSLKIALYSRNNHDFPFVARQLSASDNVHAGQVISVYLYTSKSAATVGASIFAVDAGGSQWWKDKKAVHIPQGVWYSISYKVPASFPGPAKQIGIQFDTKPLNIESIVYISTMHWSS